MFAARAQLANLLSSEISVGDENERYSFLCNTYTEYKRATTLFLKEEGTIAWLRDNLCEGDVFHDVGANIGLYTIFAADKVGPGGQVAAFEPHPANSAALMNNVMLNKMSDRVKILSCALNDTEGFLDFNLRQITAGSSMSQLSSTIDGDGEEFEPVISELKYACTLDSLVKQGVVRTPDHVKIDVDGNELLVLKGMKGVLSGKSRPRSLQVEINHDSAPDVNAFMDEYGFQLGERHYTHRGKKLLKNGGDPLGIAHNAVYVPGAA
ncbi:MAG: FkbM family methyltransferase [Hyphomicrobiales bacterium]